MKGRLIIGMLSFVVSAALIPNGYAESEKTPAKAEVSKLASPDQIVMKVTDDMMAAIAGGKQALSENPDAYFAKIRSIMEPYVSFTYIARNVMARYWNGASEDQQKKFVETFTTSMVETLGKGMANYSDLNIKTLPLPGDVGDQKRVEVEQEIAGKDNTYKVSYSLAKSKTGEWKLINVVLNGVNLGKSFRDQFYQSAKENNGDIDKVIASWSSAKG